MKDKWEIPDELQMLLLLRALGHRFRPVRSSLKPNKPLYTHRTMTR